MKRNINVAKLREYAKEYVENNRAAMTDMEDIINDFCNYVEQEESECLRKEYRLK